MISRHEIKSLLNYDPNTGVFKWVVPRKGAKKSRVAGTTHPSGYVIICVGYKLYRAHRLVFLYMTGEWPKDDVDHINRIKNDNRWCNLRQCTMSQNLRNTGLKSDNTSGFKGVSWSKRDNNWLAQIWLKGKGIHLGQYKEKKCAALAYNEKAIEIFGQFACLNDIKD